MEVTKVKISKLKLHESNPRLIKNDKFKKLKESIESFPEMLEIRPIVVNNKYTILGGNMRFKACKDLGMKEIPVMVADNLSEEQEREFVLKDNVSAGEWDWDILANEWDADQLLGLGIDIKGFGESEDDVEAEVEFSEELSEMSNYVVLYFENEIDWLSAKTHFNLKSVHSKRANGKPWAKGIGRVVDGAKYIDEINKKR